ncbi:hypothetical protein HanPSC8_Chr04g0176151 [Helianthus annuus]|nr:hypothetical protein HanLR1_Chr04g0154341 [Helianthus annuus]KAJ0932656.1 hypothetical protein HanPSC8_Chr04g0176151 [Helianthus annuus]
MFVDLISPLYVSFIFVDLGFLCIFQICKVIICVVTGCRSGNYKSLQNLISFSSGEVWSFDALEA